ncbi:MAG: arsenate reductase ArsC [Beijerinckiaceae bacterium]|jgi:protein-tyrosine-phosphatase|nr:arsenate reductase ArsC [Beijerinckiaceae bacterium]
MLDHRPYNVLFLCVANSARSIMAEAIINRIGAGTFRGFSAGRHPSGTVEPMALNLLTRLNFDVSGLRSKSWEEFAAKGAPDLDFVFTVCDVTAKEQCPSWPGQPLSAHWPVPDPVKAVGDEAQRALAFADAYRMLNNRISIFASLPVHELDKVTLQAKIDTIGQDEGRKD